MPVPSDDTIEHVLRGETPHVLGALVRRFGRFELAEDAVQEALLVANQHWTEQGLPDEPRSWLIRVGYRKMIDLIRSEQAARRREQEAASADPVLLDPAAPSPTPVDHDDSLQLLLLCCHPALSEASRVALTLRAVGGLTTGEIAHAYGTTETTMGTRISRAKQTLKKTGARFGIRNKDDVTARTDPAHELILLPDQDRTRWNTRLITEGRELIEQAWTPEHVGPYQLQAAIAAVHTQASTAARTD